MSGLHPGSAIGLLISPIIMGRSGFWNILTFDDIWIICVSLSIGIALCSMKQSRETFPNIQVWAARHHCLIKEIWKFQGIPSFWGNYSTRCQHGLWLLQMLCTAGFTSFGYWMPFYFNMFFVMLCWMPFYLNLVFYIFSFMVCWSDCQNGWMLEHWP